MSGDNWYLLASRTTFFSFRVWVDAALQLSKHYIQ